MPGQPLAGDSRGAQVAWTAAREGIGKSRVSAEDAPRLSRRQGIDNGANRDENKPGDDGYTLGRGADALLGGADYHQELYAIDIQAPLFA